MAQESPVSSLHLFKEVRVDIQPESPSSVIQFRIPSSTALNFTRASLPTRSVPKNLPSPKTEEDFVRNHLATESSIFFGRAGRYPRSFLWRILNDGLGLRIQSVDLSKKIERREEASYILDITFPSAIRPRGVAFAETEDHNTISVFVLTASNELYTLTLKRSFFYTARTSEVELGKWCQVFKPGSLNFTTPNCLLAKSSLELILGLDDGRLMRLTRKDGGDGSVWHDVVYNDGKWGSSLRSLVRWQGANSITFNGTNLEKNTPQALALSPKDNHLWVVCLDHTLKVWNLEQGRTVYTNDLLGVEREPHETAKLLLDPGSPNLVQTFTAERSLDGDRYYVMTYSPHELGQFKIWAVRDADAGNKGIRDLYPENLFRAPDPDPDPDSKAIWKMVDFKAKLTKEDTLDIWILMRSSRQYKLYTLNIPITDFARSLDSQWKDNWTTTTLETLESIPPPPVSDAEPEGIMESWTDFLLSRTRYPEYLIEFGMLNYAAAQKLIVSMDPKTSLRERMQLAVSSSVQLQRLGPEDMDFAGYRTALQQEWNLLWQEIRSLDRSRWQVLSLACDDEAEAPWIAFRSGCSPIRKCSRAEVIAHNDPVVLRKSARLLEVPSIETGKELAILPNELSLLLATAASFREGFSHNLRRACDAVLAAELWQEPECSAPLRIQSFYDRCHYDQELSDDDVARLRADLTPSKGHGWIRNTLFRAFIKALPKTRSEVQGSLSSRFGLGVIMRGAQEIISLHKQILFDLLILVVIIDIEFEDDKLKAHDFMAAPLYIELLDLLKQYQVLHWLARNYRPEPRPGSSDDDVETFSEVTVLSKKSTVLQNLFAQALAPRPDTEQAQPGKLTEDIEDVLVWTTGISEKGVSFNDVLAHIQCNLLLNNNIDLALSFLRYQPSTPWATYLKGRLHLLKGDFTKAAIYFKKAAFKLCKPLHPCSIQWTNPTLANPFLLSARPTDLDYTLTSNSLLSPTEASHLGQGLPAYYTHIQTLFRTAHSPSYVATFARLILQTTPDPSDHSPPLQTLFHASLSTSDFPTAFTSLTRLSPTTASSLLPPFLTALLAQNRFDIALTLPWPPVLRPHIDTFLSAKVATTPTTASNPHYHKLLAAWRLHHLDYRGAAAALLAYLQRIRRAARSHSFAKVGETDEVSATYLNIINLLACAGEDEAEAWVLTDAWEDVGGGKKVGGKESAGKGIRTGEKKKRKLVTIKDVRAGYQRELDGRSVLESGRWGFGLDGAGDEDEEGEGMDVDGEV